MQGVGVAPCHPVGCVGCWGAGVCCSVGVAPVTLSGVSGVLSGVPGVNGCSMPKIDLQGDFRIKRYWDIGTKKTPKKGVKIDLWAFSKREK